MITDSNKALADELQRLCCAETEGKFFDLVTDSIDQILTALRAAPARCDAVTDEMVTKACAVYERVYIDDDKSMEQAMRDALAAALSLPAADRGAP